MNAEFNWWLLIVGLVVGAGLVWLVVTDARRRDADVTEGERESEALWIAEAMTDAGRHVDDSDVLDILRLHAAYLAAPPPDEPVGLEDEPAAVDPRPWPLAPTTIGGTTVAPERRSMAHPIGGSEPLDPGGGPA